MGDTTKFPTGNKIKCSNCSLRFQPSELSFDLRLCLPCQMKVPVEKCLYCRVEYRKPDEKSELACSACKKYIDRNIQPGFCRHCQIEAAFMSPVCKRCSSFQNKYGPAKECSQCKSMSAFAWGNQYRSISGMQLCYLCTVSLEKVALKLEQKAAHGAMDEAKSNETEEDPYPDYGEKLFKTYLALEDEKKDAAPAPSTPEGLIYLLKETEKKLLDALEERDNEIAKKKMEIVDEKERALKCMMELQHQCRYLNRVKCLEIERLTFHANKLQKDVADMRRAQRKPPKKRTVRAMDFFNE